MKATLFALFIALLLVGCGNSDSKPDLTNTAPEKDPMESAVEWSKLQNKNGDAYIPNTDKPYSGWAKQNYDNEQLKVLAEFTDGSVTRLKQWQENGIPRWDIGYSKRKKSLSDVPLEDWRDSNTSLQHGLRTIWHENGQKRGKVNYKDGKLDGLMSLWYENGQVKFLAQVKDGKFDGLSSLWYENGQKKRELNYKDGKKDGLWTTWYENGQKSSESNFKDGKADGLWTEWHENGQKVDETYYRGGVKVED